MSHWTDLKTQINDLRALGDACRELGKRLEIAAPGQQIKARGYYGNTRSCDAVIHLDGPYDVALTRGADGKYSLTADYYSGHVARQLGEKCSKLTQLYGLHKTTALYRAKGIQTRRVMGQNGSINLIAMVP